MLLTFTGIIGYMIPSLSNINLLNVFLFTVFGVFSAAGGLTINNVIDRDIDEVMVRTSSRPTVGPDAISPRNLMIFGISLSLIGFVGGLLYFGVNTFFFFAFGNLFYLFGYSLYLKRNSIWNTILGGLASPAPVWAGFAARYELGSITPDWVFIGVNLEGWLLGTLVFVWTPSHTWAMATKNFEDYVNTNIPMLPVKVGLQKTGLFTLLSGLITLLYASWLAIWISNRYLVMIALIIPHLYLLRSLWIFYKEPTIDNGAKCFKAHNYWLSIVFVIILLFMWTK